MWIVKEKNDEKRTGFTNVEIQVTTNRMRKVGGEEFVHGEFSSMFIDSIERRIWGGLVPQQNSWVHEDDENRNNREENHYGNNFSTFSLFFSFFSFFFLYSQHDSTTFDHDGWKFGELNFDWMLVCLVKKWRKTFGSSFPLASDGDVAAEFWKLGRKSLIMCRDLFLGPIKCRTRRQRERKLLNFIQKRDTRWLWYSMLTAC